MIACASHKKILQLVFTHTASCIPNTGATIPVRFAPKTSVEFKAEAKKENENIFKKIEKKKKKERGKENYDK